MKIITILLLMASFNSNAFFGEFVMELTYILSPAYKELYGPVRIPKENTVLTSNEVEYCVEGQCITMIRREINSEKRDIAW